MGCACCASSLDVVAPPRKPHQLPRGAASASDFPGPTAPWPTPPGPSARKLGPAPGEEHWVVYYPPFERNATAAAAAAIIAQGAELQGVHVAPWEEQDQDIVGNFGLGRSKGEAFTDADGLLGLSKRQRAALHTWRRLPELVRSARGRPTPVVLESVPTSRAICQGLVGDCSFLSALSSLAEYERTFQRPVLSGIIWPRAGAGPAYNEYGKYACRLFLNGAMRKVVVDDRVPVRRDGRLLCAHSSCARELWVALLEKAFAKIMGSSYDVQGSNPGTDMFHLTGWLPETVPLGADVEGACWEQLFDEAAEAHDSGRCVLCVGTLELADAVPDAEARILGHIEGVSHSTGLVARHAYPVLACRHVGSHRLLRLKNPWGRVRWRGRFAPGDAAWRTLLPELGGHTKLADALGADPADEAAVDDGHFWIEWEDVVQHFSHFYLCWVPDALHLHCCEAHCRWDPEPHFTRSSLPDDTHLAAFNPQFLLRFESSPPRDKTTAAWVLVSRHVNSRAEVAVRYVAAHVHSGGKRLCCPDAPLEQGVYSNGECALVKLRGEALPSGEQGCVVVVSQHAQKCAFNFTLQVYTSVPAALEPLPPLIPQGYASGAAEGEWAEVTAGGCSNSIWQYFRNPQWRVEAASSTELLLFLECAAEHSVNVRLFEGEAARPERLRTALSSGPYRQGCCMLRVPELAPGPYIVVVSTFRPGLNAPYRLAWHSSEPLRVAPQPHPFATPPPRPLRSACRRLPRGSAARLRLAAAGPRPTLASARLQGGRKDAPAPSLRLLRAGVDEAVGCEMLTTALAEAYLASSGAAVMLLATLAPGAQYVLEATQEGQWAEALLYVMADGPVSLEPADTARSE